MRCVLLLTLLSFTTFAIQAQDRTSDVLHTSKGRGLYHPDAITSIDITPDGSTFATAGTNCEVRIWKTSSGELLKTITIKAKDVHISQVKYLKRGDQLLVNLGSDGIQLYDVKRNYSKMDQETTLKADRISSSADGELWVMQDGLSKIKLVERSTLQEKMELPEARTIALSADGKLMGFVQEKTVVVLEVPSGKPVFKWTGKTEPSHLHFSPNGRYVAVAADGVQRRAQVLDLKVQKALDTFDGEGPLAWVGNDLLVYRQRDRVCSVQVGTAAMPKILAEDVTQFAVSEDGKFLVADSGRKAGSSRLRRWNLINGEELVAKQNELQGFVSAMQVGPTPSLILKSGVVRQTMSNELVWIHRFDHSLTAHAVRGSMLLVGSSQAVRLCDVSQAKVQPVVVPGFDDGVSHLACDAKAERIAAITTGEKPLLVVCDRDGKNRVTEPVDSVIHGIAMNAEGTAVFLFSRNGQITKWDTSNKAVIKKAWATRGIRSLNGALALSPDGLQFAVATMVKVTVHNAITGKVLDTIERQWDDAPFVSLAYSGNSRMLAMGTRDTSGVMLWDADFRAVVKRFRPSSSTIWDITFDPSNRTMTTIDSDDRLTTWDISGRLLAKPPTAEQLASAWQQFGQVGGAPAWEAMWLLIDGKTDGLKIIEKGLTDTKQRFGKIEGYIADLGNPNFQKRTTATNELVSIGTAAVPLLRKAQDDTNANEEQLARIETLLTQLANKAEKHEENRNVDELLRVRRTVALLARMDSPEARNLLERFPAFGKEIEADVKDVLKAWK